MASAIIGKLKEGGEIVLAGSDTPVADIKKKIADYRANGIPDDCECVFLSEFKPRDVVRVAAKKVAKKAAKKRGRPPKVIEEDN